MSAVPTTQNNYGEAMPPYAQQGPAAAGHEAMPPYAQQGPAAAAAGQVMARCKGVSLRNPRLCYVDYSITDSRPAAPYRLYDSSDCSALYHGMYSVLCKQVVPVDMIHTAVPRRG